MIVRESLPVRPSDWDEKSTQQSGQPSKSYSYFNLDEVVSALQKSARRGWWLDCQQWSLELFWVGLACRTRAWNRLLIISLEDIGPAEPETFLRIYSLYINWPDQPVALVTAAKIVAQAVKTRVNDWAIHYIDHWSSSNKEQSALELHQNWFNQLLQALQHKQLLTCLLYCSYLWQSPFKLSPVEKRTYQTRYTNPQWLIWRAFQQVIGPNYYLQNCQQLALSNNWRWQSKSKLIYIQIIHLWIYDLLPTQPIIHQPDWTNQTIVDQFRQRINLVGMPDIAIDKHTIRGKSIGRDSQYFRQEGCRLNNESYYWQNLSNWYLAKHLALQAN